MTYAPYTNTEAKNALDQVRYPVLLGQFREMDHGKIFEYAERAEGDYEGFVTRDEFPHLIFVGPLQERRYAKVTKTRAYIVMDEEDGRPVVEKWCIRSHKYYS